jgi:hypothetical protein
MLVSLDEAKTQLRVKTTNDDQEILSWIAALTPAIEEKISKVVEPRTITERHRLTGRNTFRLWRTPVLTLTSITAVSRFVPTWDVSNLTVDPTTGIVDVLAGPCPYGIVDVTYTAGYDPIPDNFLKGALIVLQHVWESRRGVGSNVRPGVVGPEERYDHQQGNYTIPRKAMELFPDPIPAVG